MHLAADEAAAWLEREARAIHGQPGVQAIGLTELEPAPLRWGRVWHWLIEIELETALDASALAKGTSCAVLLADLRLLGMRPAIAVANPAKKRTLAPTG